MRTSTGRWRRISAAAGLICVSGRRSRRPRRAAAAGEGSHDPFVRDNRGTSGRSKRGNRCPGKDPHRQDRSPPVSQAHRARRRRPDPFVHGLAGDRNKRRSAAERLSAYRCGRHRPVRQESGDRPGRQDVAAHDRRRGTRCRVGRRRNRPGAHRRGNLRPTGCRRLHIHSHELGFAAPGRRRGRHAGSRGRYPAVEDAGPVSPARYACHRRRQRSPGARRTAVRHRSVAARHEVCRLPEVPGSTWPCPVIQL